MNVNRVCVRKLHNQIIKTKIIARDLIKPSSPTPNHLRTYQLSLLDQLGPTIFGPLVYFYQNRTENRLLGQAEKIRQLRRSLSETLTRYYPFAGRLRENTCVNCDDSGADFLAAQVNAPLASVLDEPCLEGVQRLLPTEVDSADATTKLLLAQATFFDCGGMAVGVCLSHKVADGTSIGVFMKGWAATATSGSISAAQSPVFNGASMFPPGNFSKDAPAPVVEPEITKRTVSKRFCFEPLSLQALRAECASSDVDQPTRVEAVTALLWKSAMNASRRVSKTPKPSVLAHAVNIRNRVNPKLPGNSIGNFSSYFAARSEGTNQTNLRFLVSELRKSKQKFKDKHVKTLIGNEKSSEIICEYQREAGEIMQSENCDFYIFSSLCRSGLYETDFGWGTPAWISVSCVEQKNIVSLMDSSDGDGIEAWVTLDQEHMKLFEDDKQLLDFASSNPRVIQPFVDSLCF